MKRLWIEGVAALALLAAGVSVALWGTRHVHLRVASTLSDVPADGRYHRVAHLASSDHAPLADGNVRTAGLPARILPAGDGEAELEVQSPVMAGERRVQVSLGRSTATLRLHFAETAADSAGDGTPDFLRLHTAADRSAFRGWFTSLADAAADAPSNKIPREIDDCAALLRWAYRNALHAHDETWLLAMAPLLDVAQTSVRQYAYPATPLGSALFRVRGGAFAKDDPRNGAFAQFADAKTLLERNTFLLGQDMRDARPGDLLFFRQLEQNSPYHSMIVTGGTQPAVVYHTGPIGRGPGEIRRVLVRDLVRHPDPRWRPISSNSNFLGVYRWNILLEDPR